MCDKILIKLGAGKGKLLPVVQEYLKSLGLPEIENSRKLVHTFETEKYILEVTLLRWEDIKKSAEDSEMFKVYTSDNVFIAVYKCLGLVGFKVIICKVHHSPCEFHSEGVVIEKSVEHSCQLTVVIADTLKTVSMK